MTHSARVVAHSISPYGVELATLEVVMPRIILAEFNTHRMLSRNSASSRAIPVEKMIKMVQEHPYVPTHWGKNQKGMQAEDAFDEADDISFCEETWLSARDEAVKHARFLLERGVHKQLTNRLLEPFMWHTVLVTATEWSNFFNLRCHPMAHPEIRKTAELMRDALAASTPKKLDYGQWHLPLISDEDREAFSDVDQAALPLVVGRCARVSYLTHDGKRDSQKDIELHDELLKNGHMSPFEHVARPMSEEDLFKGYVWAPSTGRGRTLPDMFCGNFRGWVQYRKTIPNEADILGER